VHALRDWYPNDACDVEDEVWVRELSELGFAFLTQDEAIRRQPRCLAALEQHHGTLFSLGSAQLTIDAKVALFHANRNRIIQRATNSRHYGFYVVHDGGISKRWPP
jgi:hypothetical protein